MRTSIATTICVLVAGSSTLVAGATSLDALVPTTQALRARRLPEIVCLEPRQTIERRLFRGDDHRYQVALKAGEWMRVVVEQRGIDVVVHLRRADGSPLADVQDEVGRGGEEKVDIVADTSAVYTVAIDAAPGTTMPGSYAIRIAARQTATETDRELYEARLVRSAAAQLAGIGRAEDARRLLERALALTERARQQEDGQVAAVLVQLAAVYLDVPDFTRAEATYLRALAIMDTGLGPEHPTTAFVRSRLATVYQRAGQRPKAEALVRPALEIIERTLGADHIWFVQSLGTLAGLLNDARDFDRAKETLERQASILEKVEDTDSILYAGVLNNLGQLYARTRDFTQARVFLGRAIEIAEQLRGSDDYFLSNPLTNLGIVAREQKDYATAEATYRRALAIRERVVGPDHPELALLLNNIANVYHATGDYARSLDTHRQALRIGETAFGPYHQNTLLSVGNIARVFAAMGDVEQAVPFQRRADAIIEKQFALNLMTGSERQKLAFVRGLSERTDRTISLHLNLAPDDPDARALAALVLLQRKGRVQDAMTDVMASVRQHVAAGADLDLLDRLNATIAQIARLSLSASAAPLVERQEQLAELEARQEQLETTLSDHSAEFRAQTQPITVEAVQAALPKDAALIEFAVFRPFDPTVERNADAYGAPHYAAYVLRQQAAPIGVDLGDAATLDQAIEALRDSLRTPTSRDVLARARAVDARVMAPLRAWLGDATRLLISPDGALNLVPFEVLVDEHGHYLLEGYATSYLTSGRDLLRMQIPRATPTSPVIVADPLFGEPTAGGPDLSATYFAPLAATRTEARKIQALFPDATLLAGPRATKTALQQVSAPRILHIASHGFFLDDGARDRPTGEINPLLRSGLALAGANVTREGRADGILTALEASNLDLWGTRLVTLSACDTGIGEVRNGEGVYGLRRAFVLAGAETLVMSLWPVSDNVARDAMVAYYTGLRAQIGRGDALRQAKLTMLKRASRRHPYYWASFIQSGEWADLDGRR